MDCGLWVRWAFINVLRRCAVGGNMKQKTVFNLLQRIVDWAQDILHSPFKEFEVGHLIKE